MDSVNEKCEMAGNAMTALCETQGVLDMAGRIIASEGRRCRGDVGKSRRIDVGEEGRTDPSITLTAVRTRLSLHRRHCWLLCEKP